MKLADRVALITGSSRGIGAAIARRLAEDGARVVLHASANRARAERVAEAIRAGGGQAHIVTGDLASREAPARIVAEAFAVHGALDILVNNAASMNASPVDAPDLDQIDRDLAVNLRAVIIATAEFVRLTQSTSGKIINISSVAAKLPTFGYGVYSATKAGLEGYTRTIAQELGGRGITVNAVMPGVTVTDRLEQAEREHGGSWREMVSRWVALRRVGEPGDIADVVAFVASDDARWLTGVTLEATGGAVAAGGTIAAYSG